MDESLHSIPSEVGQNHSLRVGLLDSSPHEVSTDKLGREGGKEKERERDRMMDGGMEGGRRWCVNPVQCGHPNKGRTGYGQNEYESTIAQYPRIL